MLNVGSGYRAFAPFGIIVALSLGHVIGYWLATRPGPLSARTLNFLQQNPQWLLQHPSILEQSRRLEARRFDEHQRDRRRGLVQAAQQRWFSDWPQTGAEAGKLTLLEFTDYACVACRVSQPSLEYLVSSNPDARFAIVFLPASGTASEFAARAAIVVWKNAPHQFLQFHQSLMRAPVDSDAATITAIANSVGVSKDTLMREAGSTDVVNALAAMRQLAADLKVVGLPSFIIDGTLITGHGKAVQHAIDEARQQSQMKANRAP